ncbi:MAG: isoleucine--tRNA ligase [Sphingomonadaceae bacterium]|nr:isoleucine--tRNA ligase [Sphingomonadaceae bacterium]
MSDTPDSNRAKAAKDFRDTVFLPTTDFPMKAGLPQKEPGIAARWESEGLYQKLRESRAGRETFILHDGPPYANGDMHIGHALNHVLKDMVCRTQNLLGKDAPYVPGWDCHGLPIEWKVEEAYRKAKKAKPVLSGAGRDEAEVKAFRDECRAYAQGWVDTQREQLKRLGIMGDWDNPYLTMQKDSEAIIVAELLKLAEAGNLYRGAKPVMWSPVEETALAEAEVEYEDITSTQIDVAFEIIESPIPELVGAHAVIWTTTPWTIPVNQALAYGPTLTYRTVRVKDAGAPEVSYLVAEDLLNSFIERVGIIQLKESVNSEIGREVSFGSRFLGSDLAGTRARHPMAGRLAPLPSGEGPGVGGAPSADAEHPSPTPSLKGRGFYETLRPLLPGDFVTTDSGTGLVHMAPDHGEDDFELCKAHGINPVFAVRNDGRYRDDWAWLGAADERRMSVINPKFNAPDGPICSDLKQAGALLAASADYQHSYPHSWRSKAKVIFRCTPQWFVPMDKDLGATPNSVRAEPVGSEADPQDQPPSFPSSDGAEESAALRQAQGERTLRNVALAEIERVRFIPEKGRNRIGSMVAGRPDWVLSRQRAWGVPITLFVRPDGTYLNDPEVNARIVAAVREEGMDAWNSANKAMFLGPDHNPDEFEMVTDILDVWFDSGTTHAFVLESGRWPSLRWPADLYLEGSDQHRGWFQSSLLESCATRGRAPYDQVLTHGFTMASDGRKMSKSLGNTIDPNKVMESYGADIIRLWALSVDFTEDHRIGDEILKGVGDQYRKLRNTFRYLLGALDGFSEAERVSVVSAMPELERYVLSLLGGVDTALRQAALEYDFNTYVRTLSDFCNEDLSAFFFDIRKDCLYCDAVDDPKRMAYRTVLDTLFHALVRYAAPVLVFTAEEVWGTRYPDGGSVHLLEWPELPVAQADSARWQALRDLREQVTEAIEPYRREKAIRSGLEALVTVPADAVPAVIDDDALAELFITATVTRGQAGGVTVTPTTDHKCGRCWRHLPEVAADGDLCQRCDTVVTSMGETA